MSADKGDPNRPRDLTCPFPAPDAAADLQSPVAEQSVLGAVLQDPSVLPGLLAMGIGERHFVDLANRSVWRGLHELQAADLAIDMITVFEHLRGLGLDEQAGGLVYLNQLAHSVPSARNAMIHARILSEKLALRTAIEVAELIRVGVMAPGATAADIVTGATEALRSVQSLAAPAAPFHEIDLARLDSPDQAPQGWFWDRYIPRGHVTLLGGHGGAGKSTLALMIAAAIAMGRDCLGRVTVQARVLYFSAEDPADLVLMRLAKVCRLMSFDPGEVRQRLHVVDATQGQPGLYNEQRRDGVRVGCTTPTYDALVAMIERYDIEFVVVDNASDAFEADEISRHLVRGFMRALAQSVRPRNGAVLLLVHVDKSTSRSVKGATNGESYSGSTAWHNSARSRLFLLETEPGLLELQHQKNNLGPKVAPLLLAWPDGGLPQPGSDATGKGMQWLVDKADTRALLALIAEFHGRGEFVSSSLTSPKNAARLFASERTCPARKPAEIAALLREAERAGLLAVEPYRTSDRKDHERWKLTEKGQIFLSAPTVPTVPTPEVGAVAAGCANCANSPPIGGSRRSVAGAHAADDTEEAF